MAKFITSKRLAAQEQNIDAMEKVKGFGKKVAEAGKTGKSKIDEIRTKDWAEPTGAVLKTVANAASLIPPPAGGVIKGALNMGSLLQFPRISAN